MRSLAAQLLRANQDIMPYAFENYANKALPASVQQIRKLLSDLLGMIPKTLIFIDGLDEYPEPQQKSMLTEILPLAKVTSGQCNVLISSRDVPVIASKMRNRPLISLRDEYSGVDEDIQNYLNEALQDLKERFEGKASEMDEILGVITLKADGMHPPNFFPTLTHRTTGMFLWVRLILDELYKCYNIEELRKAVEGLPKGIDEA